MSMAESKVTPVQGNNYRGNGRDSKLRLLASEARSFEFVALFPADEV